MLIGNNLEKTNAEYAWHLCADKLADTIRDIWLTNTGMGREKWETGFSEDMNALPGLCEEGFVDLVGLDYIFKWWGGKKTDDFAGEISVIWKLARGNNETCISCYRTWIKATVGDFMLDECKGEYEKREVTRATFRQAFALWKDMFEKP